MSVSESEEGEEVTILREEEILLYPTAEKGQVSIAVTYSTRDMPPWTVLIPKDEYTLELRAEKVRESIEQRRAQTPETIRI